MTAILLIGFLLFVLAIQPANNCKWREQQQEAMQPLKAPVQAHAVQ
jgi:hypothetical protein